MRWKRLKRDREHPAGIARYLATPSEVYIWCDGTGTGREWLANFDPRMVRRRVWMHERKRWYCRSSWLQAREVLNALPYDLLHGRRIMVAGFSRGGAVAACLRLMLGAKVHTLFAPKRYRLGKAADLAIHYRGDIVPYLPPWMAGYRLDKKGSWQPFWRAHRDAARDAAKWRYERERMTR